MSQNYRIKIELATGTVYRCNVKDTSDKLNKVLCMIDECWQSKGEKDGYVQFGTEFFRISSIVHYSFRRGLWRFFI